MTIKATLVLCMGGALLFAAGFFINQAVRKAPAQPPSRLDREISPTLRAPGIPSCPSDTQSSWKTYIQTTYGYSSQYPSTVNPVESDDTILLKLPSGNEIRIGARETPYATIAEYLADVDREMSTGYEGTPSMNVQSTKKTKVHALSIIEREEYLTAADMSQTSTYFKIGSYIIVYSLLVPPGNDTRLDQELYYAIRMTVSPVSNVSISPTCIPRPACLDATPSCRMPESPDMCPKPTSSSQPAQFCGGIAGKKCPSGYTCKLDGRYPDAGGTCIQTTRYTCPPNGYVDCMPGPDPKPECTKEALEWYPRNCPNFQGAAL